MIDYKDKGLSARIMSLLAGVNGSSLSRAIPALDLEPMDPTKKRNVKYSIRDSRILLSQYVASRHPIDKNKSIQCFYNFKGGTGKTTMCYQVACHMALCGYKVLAIDTDQQGNLTTSFGFIDSMGKPTLYDGIKNNVRSSDIIVPIFEGLDLIPGNISLVQLEQHLQSQTAREKILEKYLSGVVDNYDFIFFDCNPSVSLLNRNILNICTRMNIVAETQPNCLSAMPVVMKDTSKFYNELGKPHADVSIIPSKYEDRSTTAAEAISFMNSEYPGQVITDFAVRKSEDFLKSSRDKVPLAMFCKVNSIAFEDLVDLLKHIIAVSEVKVDGAVAA